METKPFMVRVALPGPAYDVPIRAATGFEAAEIAAAMHEAGTLPLDQFHEIEVDSRPDFTDIELTGDDAETFAVCAND